MSTLPRPLRNKRHLFAEFRLAIWLMQRESCLDGLVGFRVLQEEDAQVLAVVQSKPPPTPLHQGLGGCLAPLMVVPELAFQARLFSILAQLATCRDSRVRVVMLVFRLVQSHQSGATDGHGRSLAFESQIEREAGIVVARVIRTALLLQTIVPVAKPQVRLRRVRRGGGCRQELVALGKNGQDIQEPTPSNRFPVCGDVLGRVSFVPSVGEGMGRPWLQTATCPRRRNGSFLLS